MLSIIISTLVMLVSADPTQIEYRLQNQEWVVREQTENYLVWLGLANKALYKDITNYLTQSENPEVRWRAYTSSRRIAGYKYTHVMSIVNTRWSDFPCLDSLWYNTKTDRYADSSHLGLYINMFRDFTYDYIAKLEVTDKLTPDDDRYYSNFRLATKMLVIDMLLRDVPIEAIDELLLELHRIDRCMYQNRNLKWYTSPDIMAKLGVTSLEGVITQNEPYEPEK